MQSRKFTPELLAPCGMNCGVCKWYIAYSRGIPKQRGKVTHCSGCIPRNKNCFIKRGCKKLSQNKIRFCFECEQMPCKNLNRLDTRYTNRYGTSLVENLKQLQAKGIQDFLENQETKHQCPKCNDVISIHDKKCYSCTRTTPSFSR